MARDTSPRSIVLGQGAAPVTCANMLRRQGHDVCATSGPDDALRDWSAVNGVPFFQDLAGLVEHVSSVGFDYLFSIVNYRVLPASLLAMPRVLAVNYHDGPLPRYAGTYATSWAIINREPVHGITWHVMTDEVDAGDILKQVEVSIDAGETAASLNRKCFMVTVQAFRELVRELDAGQHRRLPQDLTRRTYYGFLDRPRAACLVDLARPAAEIDAFVRGLSFGPYANPVGTPKVLLDEVWVVIGRARTTSVASDREPGSVVASEGDTLVVATTDFDVALEALTTLQGAPVRPETDLAPNRLSNPDPSVAQRITAIYERAMARERVWLRRLASVHPLAPFGDLRSTAHDSIARPVTLSPAALAGLAAHGWLRHGAPDMLRLHATFLRRSATTGGTDVGVSTPEIRRAAVDSRDLVAAAVPVSLDVLAADHDGATADSADHPLARMFTYTRDIAIRYPDRQLQGIDPLPIVFMIADRDDDSADWTAVRGTQLTVVISHAPGSTRWEFSRSATQDADRLYDAFLAWIATIAGISG